MKTIKLVKEALPTQDGKHASTIEVIEQMLESSDPIPGNKIRKFLRVAEILDNAKDEDKETLELENADAKFILDKAEAYQWKPELKVARFAESLMDQLKGHND